MGKTEGKRPLGIARLRWEDAIKTDLQNVGSVSMGWIDLTQQNRDKWRALVNEVIKLRYP